jgi:hypothetical protein
VDGHGDHPGHARLRRRAGAQPDPLSDTARTGGAGTGHPVQVPAGAVTPRESSATRRRRAGSAGRAARRR